MSTDTQDMGGLESTYHFHHTKYRKPFFLVLGAERGSFLKKKIGTGKHVLDIGCRDGALTALYALGNTVLGLDIDREALRRARETTGINVQQADLNGIWGVPDHLFDVVVAAEVLEHLYYPDRILEKVVSALKPGGIFVGSVPHAFSLQNRAKLLFGMKSGTPLQDPTHINHFTYAEFRSLLARHFDVVELQPMVTKRYRLMSIIAPFLFAHGILFYARTRTR